MKDRFKFRIPMFSSNKKFKMFLYVKLYDDIYCSMNYYLGEGQQCIGLKDKNGKLIYEGDIVEETYYSLDLEQVNKTLYEVVYDEEHAFFGFKEIGSDYIEDLVNCTFEQDEIEVVGNILENPKLLKSED